jgi:ubiquinone/menaquinone biosynthesis C-methylase UbiE
MSDAIKVLDLGCGNKKRLGAVGVDFNSRTDADIVHNLNVFPYPFEDLSFDEIYIDNTLEHLDDVMAVMEELHRICKQGGVVKVIVPYFRSLWACIDPTHKHFFTVNSFAYFDPENIICSRYDYTLARFSVEKIVFNETLKTRWTRRLVSKLANRWPFRYEYYLSHLYPLDDITYYLRRL